MNCLHSFSFFQFGCSDFLTKGILCFHCHKVMANYFIQVAVPETPKKIVACDVQFLQYCPFDIPKILFRNGFFDLFMWFVPAAPLCSHMCAVICACPMSSLTCAFLCPLSFVLSCLCSFSALMCVLSHVCSPLCYPLCFFSCVL